MSKILPILLFLLLFCSTASAETIFVNETGWYRSGDVFNATATPIQHAVDNATAGDTVYVWNGTYTENVNITTENFTLQGEGRDVVTIIAADVTKNTILISANYVNISGFRITGTDSVIWDVAGVSAHTKTQCNISNNNISDNNWGVSLYNTDNTTIENNIVSSNEFGGIYLALSCSDVTIYNNTLSLNSYQNIYVHTNCDGNTITNNSITSGTIHGIFLVSSDRNNIKNNIVNSCGYAGLYMYDSNYNTFYNNTFHSNNEFGVHVRASSHNIYEEQSSFNNTQYDYRSWHTSINNTLLNCNLSNASSMMNDSTSQWIIKYTDSKITNYSDTTLNQTISPADVTTYILPTVNDYAITMDTLDDFTATTDVSTALLQLVEFNPGGHSSFKVSSDTPTIITTFNMGGFTAGEVVRLNKNKLGVTCGRANAAGVATFVYADGYSDHDFETDPVSLYVGLVGANHSFTTDSYNATNFTSQINITRNGTGTCTVSIEMPLITNTSYTKLSYTVTNVTNGFIVTNNSGWAAINFTITDNATINIVPCESEKTSNLPLVIGGGAAVIAVIVFLRRRRR